MEPPLEPPGTRSVHHGLRVGPKAECSVDEPIANSSRLVFPTTTAPAAAQALDDGRVVRRVPVLEDLRDEQVVRTPRVHMLSLSATGTPASSPGILAADTDRSTSAARVLAPVGVDGDERVKLAVRVAISRVSASSTSAAGASLAADTAPRSPVRSIATRGSGGRSARCPPLMAPHPGSRGTLNRPDSVAGRLGEHLVAVERRLRLVDREARSRAGAGVRSARPDEVSMRRPARRDRGRPRAERRTCRALRRIEVDPRQARDVGRVVAGEPVRRSAESVRSSVGLCRSRRPERGSVTKRDDPLQ